MKLPDEVKIGHRKIKLDLVKKLADKEDAFYYGEYIRKTHTIKINASQPADEMLNTTLHEIMHAICSVNQLATITSKMRDDEVREEYIVTTMTNHLILLFEHNPKFLAWFVSEIKKGSL